MKLLPLVYEPYMWGSCCMHLYWQKAQRKEEFRNYGRNYQL
jgi:hypothetical protein